ncbi:MAG TPA: HlyD family efflux transporter periplasmic adaptor subunit [Cyclobacteriaceae bacterium]|nr:HlyD family efflux transporter periplasmic adaptor subunit [Cyclobacteriaceae bacterium]
MKVHGNLLPLALIEFTLPYHISRYSRPSQVIYLVLIFSSVMMIALLPFLQVDISVTSPGLLKAATEVTSLRAPSSGVVKKVFIRENADVKEGQCLIEIKSPVLDERERYLTSRLAELSRFHRDAKQLLFENDTRWNPETGLYRQSLSDFRQKLTDRQTRFLKVQQDYLRNKKLFEQQVIAAAEFENLKYEYDKAKGEIDLLTQNQLTNWQQELRNYEREIGDYRNQLAQTQQEKENLNVRAPITGTVQNLPGIYPGSSVFANQDLMQISPKTDLVAEIYVAPGDIGLLQPGMSARLQVDAFNYNQWGLLAGVIQEISSDIYSVNDQPVFKLKCHLRSDHLHLKNGYRGKLKKGMSVQARFIIAKRSLWQLLYDKADNWVNPNHE